MKEKNETLSSKLINNSKEIVSKSSNIKHCFPVAGIVASAEGLKAFELFFKKVPEKSGISFIVIQHQDLSKEIILPELLQKITTIEVHWVTDGTKIKPNAIYVIPSNKSLSILNGTLLLFDAIESASHRLPLDVFFRSLAADQKQNSIAILLSDIGFDGNLGIKSIKENNGIVVSQEPSSENSYNLPHYISESVNADIIAPVEELPIKLLNLITNRTDYLKEKPEKNFERSIGKIISLLRQNSGNDFSMYKKSTFLRRIERRKEVHQIKTLKNYVLFMEENPQECEILFKELLIGVTSFFRDSEVWEQLENLALLNSIQKFEDGYMMRAWVTGCSTGEEAYSLAITFSEIMEKHLPNKKINLQIFATDLDKESIEKARKGLFSSNI